LKLQCDETLSNFAFNFSLCRYIVMMYFLLHNAEKFYHQPSSVGTRQWSSHAW